MEGNEELPRNKEKNLRSHKSNGITKVIKSSLPEFKDNITMLDLSNSNIAELEESITIPPNITHLNISHNKLSEVPPVVLNLEKLRVLDISYNSIVYFDNTPNCTHTIEQLNLSQNILASPPYWVWSRSPKNLIKLDLSGNPNICLSFVDGYFEELLNYTTTVKEIDIYNCRMDKHLGLMATFSNARIINVGTCNYKFSHINYVEQLPCRGLDQCCDVERLNLANTSIYTINSNIDIYKHLIEINLAHNNIYSLPNEFCNLLNLEICVLSFNKLMYLPEDMYKLKEIRIFYIDNNELCLLPACVNDLPKLRILDVYNNKLHDQLDVINVKKLDEIDMARNYFEEPSYLEYLIRKDKLRLNWESKTSLKRDNGCKPEEVVYDRERTPETSDDEVDELMTSGSENPVSPKSVVSPPSSPEDWDSDDYWIPRFYPRDVHPHSPWLYFVKKKMAEGNFCPMDAHTVSIMEQVRYEKLCNPQQPYESDGQFDDYSEDDS